MRSHVGLVNFWLPGPTMTIASSTCSSHLPPVFKYFIAPSSLMTSILAKASCGRKVNGAERTCEG